MADALQTDDTKAMHLISTSGVLNQNVTIDRLMDVARQLAELEPADGAPIDMGTYQVFAGSFYVYKQVTR
jgi:hypothetical protein